MINAAALTVVSESKDDFLTEWGNNAEDSRSAEKDACHWSTVTPEAYLHQDILVVSKHKFQKHFY